MRISDCSSDVCSSDLLIRDVLVLPQTAGSLTFLGAMFIVLLAPIFSGLWGWLDRFGANPSKPGKSAFGLLFAGLAFVPLAYAAERVGASGAMSPGWWLVLASFILESTEARRVGKNGGRT